MQSMLDALKATMSKIDIDEIENEMADNAISSLIGEFG